VGEKEGTCCTDRLWSLARPLGKTGNKRNFETDVKKGQEGEERDDTQKKAGEGKSSTWAKGIDSGEVGGGARYHHTFIMMEEIESQRNRKVQSGRQLIVGNLLLGKTEVLEGVCSQKQKI